MSKNSSLSTVCPDVNLHCANFVWCLQVKNVSFVRFYDYFQHLGINCLSPSAALSSWNVFWGREGLCLNCHRNHPKWSFKLCRGLVFIMRGEVFTRRTVQDVFLVRQGKQQQLCTSSWGGLYLCVCMCAHVCTNELNESVSLCVLVCVCFLCVSVVGVELTEHKALKAQPR